MIEQHHKHALTNARTYQGTLVFSDHRLLVTTINVNWHVIHKHKNKTNRNKTVKIDTQKLIHNEEIQTEYKTKLRDNINASNNKQWSSISNIIKNTAQSVIGVVTKTRRKFGKQSEKIGHLSQKQKDIKVAIDNSTDANKIGELRHERNRVLKEIKYEQKLIINKDIDEKVEEVASAQNDHQFFKALKFIRNPMTKQKAIVHDTKGRSVHQPSMKYNIVKQHFEKQFYDETKPMITSHVGDPQPLARKIEPSEIKNAVKRASNNKAPGEDEIQIDLIKYAPENVFVEIANILNEAIETRNSTIELGKSILMPIPKPGKAEGPPKHLRPLNLLNCIRKILSTVTLNRIRKKVDGYISHTQAAYRNNRSTTDIVWAHRFIIAKVMKYQKQTVMITGLDMSSAFDTIDREELMSILEEFLDEDEVRMCRLLLSTTTTTLRFDNSPEQTFSTNKGSPQGDAISGVFFNMALENALRDLRNEIRSMNPINEHDYYRESSLPPEMIYADDSDFVIEDKEKDKHIEQIAETVLSRHSLSQ